MQNLDPFGPFGDLSGSLLGHPPLRALGGNLPWLLPKAFPGRQSYYLLQKNFRNNNPYITLKQKDFFSQFLSNQ